MHDCEATQTRLVDLLFGELEAAERAPLLGELERCAPCLTQYRTMAEALEVFDRAAEETLPAEDFWPGYEERLRERMAQEIRSDIWRQPAAPFPFAGAEYRLTFLEDEGLVRRLARELSAAARESELTWPEFKRDPFGFTRRSAVAYTQVAYRFFSQRNVALATLSSFFLVSLMLGTLYGLERLRASRAGQLRAAVNAELELKEWVGADIPKEQEPLDKGTAGTNEGKGGGSKQKYERPAGGGGGGRNEAAEASHGKLPTAQLAPVIVAANPRPPAIKNPSLPMPATMDVDPALIKPDLRDVPYGLPNSTASTPSSGQGSGGGMGSGEGGGMGSGEGGGVGPGRGGNIGGGDRREGGGGPGGGGGGGVGVDYNRTFKVNEVSRRAVIVHKPEPGFTEEARRENVTGIVRLRAVLSSSGAVTNISVVKGLPGGLTEKAINAARSIKFQPAQKDGRTVSQWVTLEYNFNIY